ncbi:MAG: NUDIX hydrolase [Ardenticatenaceae bacterium]|nr:NUDIX hydrolase [Ardenticatenaceae bacterium]
MSRQNENWRVLQKEVALEHPFVNISMEKVRLPDGQVIDDWPKIYTRDYVNALVLNEAGEAMIIEGYKHGSGWSSWQMVGGYLEEGEDPYTAIQRELLEETGYSCTNWRYLGSYTIDANRHVGIGHFFYASGAKLIAPPNHDDLEAFTVNWVSVEDLKYALLDGRIGVISYATNVALALLMIQKH